MQKIIPLVTDQTKIKPLINQLCQFVELELVDILTSGLYAKSSLLAITKDWNLFVEFCHAKSVSPLPASITAVRQYIEKIAKEKKYATVRRYTVTISLIHRVLSLPDPIKNRYVQMSLADIRLNKRGDSQPTQAFNQTHLDSLSVRLSKSTLIRDWRNLAMYHVMYQALMKRKDLRDLCFSQLVFIENHLSVSIDDQHYPLSDETTQIVNRWLAVRGTQGKYVFTAIDRHENVSDEQLNDSSIYRVLRAASDMLNLDEQFSGQSLRVGAVTELARQGMKAKDIQHAGRWLSPAMPYQYIGNKAQSELETIRFLAIKPIN